MNVRKDEWLKRGKGKKKEGEKWIMGGWKRMERKREWMKKGRKKRKEEGWMEGNKRMDGWKDKNNRWKNLSSSQYSPITGLECSCSHKQQRLAMKIWSDDKTGLRSVNMFLSVSCSACPQQHQTPSTHSHAHHTLENTAITLTNVPMFWNINISHGWAIILHTFIQFSNVFQLNNCSRCCYLNYFPLPNDFYIPKVIPFPCFVISSPFVSACS